MASPWDAISSPVASAQGAAPSQGAAVQPNPWDAISSPVAGPMPVQPSADAGDHPLTIHGGKQIAAPDLGAQSAAQRGFVSGMPIIGPALNAAEDFVGSHIGSAISGLSPEQVSANAAAIGQQTDEAHPVANTIGAVAGGIAATAPVVAAAPAVFGAGPGALTAGKVLAGLGSGAAIGGTDAAIRSGGNAGSIALGAGVGGVAGAAGPVIGAGLGRMGEAIADWNAQRGALNGLGVSRPAADVITRAAEADGTLGGPGATNIASAGPNGMLADAGPGVQNVLDTALQRGGPGAVAARRAVEQRAADADVALTHALDTTLGTPQGIQSATNDIRDSTAPARRQTYDAAYAAPIDWSSDAGKGLKALLKRIDPSDLARAKNLIQKDPEVPLPKRSEWVPAVGEDAPLGALPPDRPFAPLYDPDAAAIPRPEVPRPQSLVNFLQSAGGVRDHGGDLKSMGLNRFPGLVRSEGGLSPDMARQAAAQAGYLGPHIDSAMADTTINDLLDALDRHPAYSVYDDDAVHAWEMYEQEKAHAGEFADAGRPAPPPRAPNFFDAIGNPRAKPVPPTVREIDYITRALNDVARAGDGQGVLGGNTNQGRINANLAKAIRGQLRQAVPEYATALDTAAEPIQARNALEFGSTMLRPTMPRDVVADEIRGMTQPELRQARQGLRSQMAEALANVKRTITDPNIDARQAMDVVKQLSSDAAQEKIGLLISRQERAALSAALLRATRALELRAALATNSRTAARLLTNEVVKGAAAPGPLGKLAAGEPLKAGKATVQFFTRNRPADIQAREDAIYSELADHLTRHRGANAIDFLTQLQQAHAARGAANSFARQIPYTGATQSGLLSLLPLLQAEQGKK